MKSTPTHSFTTLRTAAPQGIVASAVSHVEFDGKPRRGRYGLSALLTAVAFLIADVLIW
ncbi:MAG: hypothetical protein KGM15_12620 [Pseudomonadota bacterium]|nr:hypothetical protein [Pseudomonadota bacterium]